MVKTVASIVPGPKVAPYSGLFRALYRVFRLVAFLSRRPSATLVSEPLDERSTHVI